MADRRNAAQDGFDDVWIRWLVIWSVWVGEINMLNIVECILRLIAFLIDLSLRAMPEMHWV